MGTPLTLIVGVCPPLLAMPVPAVRPNNPVLFSVTVPLVPPPLSPVPAVTPVIVPVPVLLQAQALPLHCNTCFAVHACVSDRLSVPLVPPPVSPLPLAVVTPVIVPSPPAKAMSSSGGWLVVVFSLLSK